MKRKFLKGLTLALTVSTCLIPAVDAFAAEGTKNSEIIQSKSSYLSVKGEQALRKALSDDNISVETQDKLINIKKEGKLWDLEKRRNLTKYHIVFLNL